MNTKKDFILAAKLVQQYGHNNSQSEALISAFTQFFQEQNPRFDAKRFREACYGQRSL